MSLFNQIVGAMGNSQQQANPNQLGSVLNTVQNLASGSQANPDSIQSAMSIVGNFTRSALQTKQKVDGEEGVQATIDRFAGTDPNPEAVTSLFGASQINNMTEQITQKTGLSPQMIQGMLPSLVPLVLNCLKSGNVGSIANNPMLKSFLDADGDGDVDFADVMKLMSK